MLDRRDQQDPKWSQGQGSVEKLVLELRNSRIGDTNLHLLCCPDLQRQVLSIKYDQRTNQMYIEEIRETTQIPLDKLGPSADCTRAMKSDLMITTMHSDAFIKLFACLTPKPFNEI